MTLSCTPKSQYTIEMLLHQHGHGTIYDNLNIGGIDKENLIYIYAHQCFIHPLPRMTLNHLQENLWDWKPSVMQNKSDA